MYLHYAGKVVTTTTVSNRDLGIRNEHTKNMIDQSLLMLRESKFINIQIILEGLFLLYGNLQFSQKQIIIHYIDLNFPPFLKKPL